MSIYNDKGARGLERDMAPRFLGALATMLVYWFGVTELLKRTDWLAPFWFTALAFLLPVVPVFLLFVGRPGGFSFRRGMRHYQAGRHEAAAAEFRGVLGDLHTGAALVLGEMYLNGRGVKRNPDTAMDLFRAALSHHYFTTRLLPDCVRSGSLTPRQARRIGREQSPEELEGWLARLVEVLEREAGDGNTRAMSLLGDLFALRRRTEGSAEKSVHYSRLAAAATNDAEDRLTLAQRLLDDDNATAEATRESLAILEDCFAKGDAHAGWFLALHYAEEGNAHIGRDWQKVARCLRALVAAVRDAGDDADKLVMYVETISDLMLANREADNLTPDDCRRIGQAFLDSPDVDEEKARHWLRLAERRADTMRRA